MAILKNVLLFFATIILSIPLGSFFGNIYADMFNAHGSFIDMTLVAGVPFAYELLLPLLFTAFGGEKKYWWLGIGLIPAAVVELYLDPFRIYFPILLALLGWLIGFGIRKGVSLTRRRIGT